MAEQTKRKGKFLIVTGSLTAPNQNEWIAAMKKRMKQKYPKMKIASVQPGEENLQKGIDVTKSYLSANPDTTGVFGITTVALPGVAEAVRQLGLTGKVAVTGLTDPVIAKPYIDAGVVKKAMLWNPEDLGYLAVYVAKKMIDGTMPKSRLVQGRPPRPREADRQGRDPARQAARLHQAQRRQVQVLSAQPRRAPAAAAAGGAAPSRHGSAVAPSASARSRPRAREVVVVVLGAAGLGLEPHARDPEPRRRTRAAPPRCPPAGGRRPSSAPSRPATNGVVDVDGHRPPFSGRRRSGAS